MIRNARLARALSFAGMTMKGEGMKHRTYGMTEKEESPYPFSSTSLASLIFDAR
jgi:hypothetical protein